MFLPPSPSLSFSPQVNFWRDCFIFPICARSLMQNWDDFVPLLCTDTLTAKLNVHNLVIFHLCSYDWCWNSFVKIFSCPDFLSTSPFWFYPSFSRQHFYSFVHLSSSTTLKHAIYQDFILVSLHSPCMILCNLLFFSFTLILSLTRSS